MSMSDSDAYPDEHARPTPDSEEANGSVRRKSDMLRWAWIVVPVAIAAAAAVTWLSRGGPVGVTIEAQGQSGHPVTVDGMLLGPVGGDGPVRLCFAVDDSLPPSCDGIVVEGINDVAALEGSASHLGKAWGDFRLEGVYRDEVLTVTKEPEPYERTDPSRHNPGGMDPIDYRAELADLRRYAARYPETFAGWWFDLRERNVLVVAFTQDHQEHQTAISEFWPHGLRVVDRPNTVVELDTKAAEIRGPLLQGELTDLMAMFIMENESYVHLTVVLADEETVAEYHRRFGSELIRLEGWLQPLDGPNY